MSTVSLEEFLKPVSAALGRDVPPSQVDAFSGADAPHAHGGLTELSPDELVEVYLKEAEAVGLQTRRVSPEDEGKALAEMAVELGAGSVVYANVERARECGLAQALEDAGVEARAWDARDPQGSIAAAEQAKVGITFAFAAVAETATVVQICTEDSGRSICLLPEAHIASVKRSEFVPYALQALQRLDKVRGERMPSNVVFITGPSSTADIELVRVVGMHGPVAAGVVVVDD